MKLVVVVFSVLIFVIQAAPLEIDPTDDKTIDYFLAQFFQGGDPSIFKSIEAEVKKHSGELLNEFLSLIGGNFDFEASDLKAQLKKFQQDFDIEKLKRVVENIFGLGSVVVSQLEKNSATVKDKIIAFIDSALIGSGSARKKRASEDRFEFNRDSAHKPTAENDYEKKKDKTKRENQQGKSNSKDGVINKIKERKNKLAKIIPKRDSLKFEVSPDLNNREDVDEKFLKDTPTQNEESKTDQLDPVNQQRDIPTKKGESNRDQNSDNNIQEDSDDDNQEPTSRQNVRSDKDSQDPTNSEVLQDDESEPDTEVDNDDRNEEKCCGTDRDTGVRTILKKITSLSQELVEEVASLSKMKTNLLEYHVKEVVDKITESAEESSDRAFQLINMYGDDLYELFGKVSEKVRRFLQA